LKIRLSIRPFTYLGLLWLAPLAFCAITALAITLLIRSPARHVTAEQVLQTQLHLAEKPSPEDRREIELLLGPPTVEEGRRAITWCGWTYSIQGYHEVSLTLDLDDQGAPLWFWCSETHCTLWERLKEKLP
jgi:hypothetical protein